MSLDTSSSSPPSDVDLPVAPAASGRWRRFANTEGWRSLSSVAPIGVLVALMIMVWLADPAFMTIDGLQAVALQASIILLLSAGQTLVIMTGAIDLSVASLTSLGTVLLALWLPDYGAPAVLFVVVLLAFTGMVQGYVQAKTQVPSFIITLGGLGIWHSLGLALSHASAITVSEGLDTIGWLNGVTLGIPNTALGALLVVAIGTAAAHWLPIGRYMRAMGGAERAALLSGISPTFVRVFVFGASGLSAALAATALVAQQQSGSPSLADGLLLPGIAAVVVGGTAITGGSGGLQRTIVGALIISVLRVGMGLMGIDPHYEQIVYGVLVIVAIVASIDRRKVSMVK